MDIFILTLTFRVTLLDHLVCYLGKAITVQVKVKGASGVPPSTVMMGTSIIPDSVTPWFTRGETTKKHAQLAARLLSDMAEVCMTEHYVFSELNKEKLYVLNSVFRDL